MNAEMNPPTIEERLITVEEYLAAEEDAERESEYLDGLLFPVTATSRRHNIIVTNLHALLQKHLQGSPCRAYIEKIMVRIEEANCCYYPDVLVTCDEQKDTSWSTSTPVLVVEVLSPSTFATDRREKKRNYRRLRSLDEYLLVHQKRQEVNLYRKQSDSSWKMTVFGSGDTFDFESLPNGTLRVLVADIYADTDAPQVNVVKENVLNYVALNTADEWYY